MFYNYSLNYLFLIIYKMNVNALAKMFEDKAKKNIEEQKKREKEEKEKNEKRKIIK